MNTHVSTKYDVSIGGTHTQTFRTSDEAECFRQQMLAIWTAGEFTVYPTIEMQFQTTLGETIRYFEVTYRKWTEEGGLQ